MVKNFARANLKMPSFRAVTRLFYALWTLWVKPC